MKTSNPLSGRALAAAILASATFLLQAGLIHAQAVNQAASGASANYQISPDDLIGVTVFQETELTTQARVAGDGSINLPLIGTVHVRGLTAESAAFAISRDLADGYLVDPQVTVNIITYSKRTFTVLGQVGKPGTFEIPENRSVTLLDAVGMAGGFTRIASQKRVILKRRVGGQVQVTEINAKNLAHGGGSHGIEIQEGDIITVPESVF